MKNYTYATAREADAAIEECLKRVDEALDEATKIARANKRDFSWDGPEYGMGGYYVGDPEVEEGAECSWYASSQSC